MKNLYFIIISILIILFIVTEVKKSHLSIKESFFWIVLSFCTLVLSIFPRIINKAADIFGVSYPPTIFFVFVILFLCFIIFRITKILSFQNEKIIDLTEQVAIIKSKIDDKNNPKK